MDLALNVTDFSDSHRRKEYALIVPTDARMRMLSSLLIGEAYSPISRNTESVSNVTVLSDLHDKKHLDEAL
jgi:hypothetical protein